MALKDIGLAILVATLWGFNFIAIRKGLDHSPPFLLCALRFFFLAFPAVFFVPKPPIAWRHFISVGFFLGITQFTCLFFAMKNGVPASISSIVVQTQPFFTAILAIPLLNERLRGFQWLGMLISFSGVVLIAGGSNAGVNTINILALLGAAASLGMGNILVKKMGPTPAVPFLIWMGLIPPIPMLLLSYWFEGGEAILQTIEHFDSELIIALAYIIIMSTVVGYGGWNWLLGKYPASTVAPFSLLVPLFGVCGSMLILGEAIHSSEIKGAIVILLGLMINLFGLRIIQWLKAQRKNHQPL